MPTIDPGRTALMLCDLQPGILGRLEQAESERVLERAGAALRVARGAGVPVVFARVAFAPQDFASVSHRNRAFAAVAEARGLEDGSPQTAVHPDVAPAPADVVVTKTRVGAFSTTNLGTHLTGRGIDTLVIGGVSTSGVVLSTVRDAADRDFGLHVLGDCCADLDDEVHRVLLGKVLPRQADVTDVEGFAAAL